MRNKFILKKIFFIILIILITYIVSECLGFHKLTKIFLLSEKYVKQQCFFYFFLFILAYIFFNQIATLSKKKSFICGNIIGYFSGFLAHLFAWIIFDIHAFLRIKELIIAPIFHRWKVLLYSPIILLNWLIGLTFIILFKIFYYYFFGKNKLSNLN